MCLPCSFHSCLASPRASRPSCSVVVVAPYIPNMHDGYLDPFCRSISRLLLLPSSLLSLLAVLPGSTIAQDTVTSAAPLLTIVSTPPTATSLPQTAHTRSMTTSFIVANTSHVTTSTAIASTGSPVTNDVLSGSGRPNQDPNEGVFHYYWLILALFGVLVAVFLWWVNRRRRRRKEQMRLDGQDALARDMEGWINTRRWFHGTWRPNQTREFERREEGLNEHGEAPPPYRPKGDVTDAEDSPQNLSYGLSLPLRTLSREGLDASRLPGYRETVSRRSLTSSSHITQS